MPRVRNTPRRPRSRSAENGGAARPLESPSTGQFDVSASPGKRAVRSEAASDARSARPNESGSVAAAAHHAPHPAHDGSARSEGREHRKARTEHPEPVRSDRRKPRTTRDCRRARHTGEAGTSSPRTQPEEIEIPPGPTPADGRAFIEAVSTRIDLVAVSEKILKCKDLRVAEKHLDRLLDLGYVKTAPVEDLPPVVLPGDLPRPDRGD